MQSLEHSREMIFANLEEPRIRWLLHPCPGLTIRAMPLFRFQEDEHRKMKNEK